MEFKRMLFLSMSHTKSEIDIHFTGIPASLLNMVFKTSDLIPVIGPIIDLNFKSFFDPTKEKPGYCDMMFDSQHFHVRGRFKLEDNATIYDSGKLPMFHIDRKSVV